VLPEPAALVQDSSADLLALLDQEISRLPERYRVSLVLCDLEGRTRREAAQQLGLPEGTVSGRITTARRLLAKRLTRRGVTLSAGALTGTLARSTALAGTPAANLTTATVKAAMFMVTGKLAGTSALPASVAALVQGVLKMMFLTKLKIAAVVVLSIVAVATCMLTCQALAQKSAPSPAPGSEPAKEAAVPQSREVSGTIKAVDVTRSTITLHGGKRSPTDRNFPLAGDVKVFLDDGTGDRLGFQLGKAADLSAGLFATLRLAEKGEAAAVWLEGPTIQGVLQAVDKANNTITAKITVEKGKPPADKTYSLARDVKVLVDHAKPRDKLHPAPGVALADLPIGTVVQLKLSAHQSKVAVIRAAGPSVSGVVKAVDAAKGTLSITMSVKKGEPLVDKTFVVAKDAMISLDTGKPRNKLKPQGLDDVPAGAIVTLQLSLDQRLVVAIHIQGASLDGISVKAVDADKNTITVAVPVKKGEPLVDMTYTVPEDAVVVVDGKDGERLRAVPIDALVSLRLSPERKAVREIRAYGPSIKGTVKGNNNADRITLADKRGEQTYTTAKQVTILIDRKRPGKATELIDGTVAELRLSADKTAVLQIRAEGPSFHGTVKAVDPDKKTITLNINAKTGEDKELAIANDAMVATEIYGVALKLADVRVGRNVLVRLAIDQKAAARITVCGE
jgi:hypothetical protein